MSRIQPGPATDPRRRRRTLVLAAALAVVLVIAIVALAVSRGGSPGTAPSPTTPVLPTPSPTAESTAATTAATASAGPSPSRPPTPTAASAPSRVPATSTPSSVPAQTPTSSPPVAPTATFSSSDAPSTPPSATGNQTTKAPVPLDRKTEVTPGLSARVDRLAAVTGEARGPGEVGGPAVRFRVVVSNDGPVAIPLTSTVVNTYFGPDRIPATAVSGPGVVLLPASVASGRSVSGTFVFVVPPEDRARVLITVDYAVDTSVVAFEGRAPS